LTIYLDSNDFSRLADPRQEAIFGPTLAKLKEIATHPQVAFLFSAAHLSEMAPTGHLYANAAARRADVLVALCKRNALIPYFSILELEANRLVHGGEPLRSADLIAMDGTWFPEVKPFLNPAAWADAFKEALSRSFQEQGLNRRMRRVLNGKLMKHGSPRAAALQELAPLDPAEVMRHFPMREEDARVISLYAAGRATTKEADHALRESLRDPRWMMRWFHQNFEDLGKLGEMIRGPSTILHAKASGLVDKLNRADEIEKVTGRNPLTKALWTELANIALIQGTNSIIKGSYPDARFIDDPARIRRVGRGISTFIGSVVAPMRDSTGHQKRAMATNDVADATHAIYAPYVRFFRADKYMAPVIQRQVKEYGTQVVNRLEDLPGLIESALRQP